IQYIKIKINNESDYYLIDNDLDISCFPILRNIYPETYAYNTLLQHIYLEELKNISPYIEYLDILSKDMIPEDVLLLTRRFSNIESLRISLDVEKISIDMIYSPAICINRNDNINLINIKNIDERHINIIKRFNIKRL